MDGITGSTRLYAVVGDPVRQVRAPGMLNTFFARAGIDAVLVPVHVRPADLAATVLGLQLVQNLDGLLITVPHKVAVRDFADAVSPAVELSGSANAMRREPDGTWYAENFDGAGFLAGLLAAGHDPVGRTVTVVGAGGAGSAIAPAVLTAGAATVHLCDVDTGRAAALAARLERRWPGRTTCASRPVLEPADIVVNATPLGLRPDDPLPFDPAAVRPGTVVADIIMRPRETGLLRAAAALGLPVHFGAPMLDRQLDLYREFFQFSPATSAARPVASAAAP